MTNRYANRLGKVGLGMPKKSGSYVQPFSKEDGTALVRAIRQYASRFPRQKEVSATFEEMEAFDTDDELDFGGGEDGPNGRMPRPDTLRNWIEGSSPQTSSTCFVSSIASPAAKQKSFATS